MTRSIEHVGDTDWDSWKPTFDNEQLIMGNVQWSKDNGKPTMDNEHWETKNNL